MSFMLPHTLPAITPHVEEADQGRCSPLPLYGCERDDTFTELGQRESVPPARDDAQA